jgi:hypothetical protein
MKKGLNYRLKIQLRRKMLTALLLFILEEKYDNNFNYGRKSWFGIGA